MLDLHIGKPQTRTILTPGPDSSACPHTVLRVNPLFVNETWILDTTGSQYGFQDVLIPYDRYIKDKGCRVSSEPTTYDAIETKDLDYFETLPFMTANWAQRENLKVDRRARLHFAAFVDTFVHQDMIDGSDAQFEAKFDFFILALKLHLMDVAK